MEDLIDDGLDMGEGFDIDEMEELAIDTHLPNFVPVPTEKAVEELPSESGPHTEEDDELGFTISIGGKASASAGNKKKKKKRKKVSPSKLKKIAAKARIDARFRAKLLAFLKAKKKAKDKEVVPSFSRPAELPKKRIAIPVTSLRVKDTIISPMKKILAEKGFSSCACPEHHIGDPEKKVVKLLAEAKIQREATSEHRGMVKENDFRARVLRLLRRCCFGGSGKSSNRSGIRNKCRKTRVCT